MIIRTKPFDAGVDPCRTAEQLLGVKSAVAAAFILFAASSGAAVVRRTVSAQELASAINRADAVLVPYRTKMVSPADVRAVRCMAPDEEPTEFKCRWQHRTKGVWTRRTTWLVVDSKGWHVMDA